MPDLDTANVGDVFHLRRMCLFAGGCVLFFLAAQIFQAVVYWFVLPEPQSVPQELVQRALAIDRARSLLVMAGIVALLVPYVTIAILRFRAAPFGCVLGVIFASLFVAAELFHRSLDFFVVSIHWADDYRLSDAARDVIVQRCELWNQMVRGWYFPLLLTFLLASICFVAATWGVQGRWAWLAPVAFGLNAIRLLARMLDSFAGQRWLAAFNGLGLYFTLVALINGMLAAWFFWLAQYQARDPEAAASSARR